MGQVSLPSQTVCRLWTLFAPLGGRLCSHREQSGTTRPSGQYILCGVVYSTSARGRVSLMSRRNRSDERCLAGHGIFRHRELIQTDAPPGVQHDKQPVVRGYPGPFAAEETSTELSSLYMGNSAYMA